MRGLEQDEQMNPEVYPPPIVFQNQTHIVPPCATSVIEVVSGEASGQMSGEASGPVSGSQLVSSGKV